ncbi:PspC domain-containing protein [Streptacidiphilus sp. ASG 303]|uniref:PspC domain-containing protein n=1 Tax=Streptacidiphilus sp. ASG 303 TaxID=2896847 RepID=UPI001E503BCD|nr:PspC domain-containing protein [Streptacidiphilus sp. ASG 303]MCD0481915.1 PspC domain-containing protein [Streptacidiphilus sp. ASG 303]
MTDDRTQPPPADGRASTAAPGPDGSPAAGRPGGARPPLVRSDRHRVVAGVCGGLGRHLDIDPVVFRVVIAVLCLSGGLGLFLYGLAWLIVPAEGERRPEIQRLLTGHVDAQSIGAVLLTVIGTGVFFSWMDHGNHLFPVLLLGGLVFLAMRYDPERRRRQEEGRGPGRPHAGVGGRPAGTADGGGTAGGPGGPDGGGGAPWHQDAAEAWAEARAALRTALAEGREEVRRAAPSPTGYRWDPRHPERNPYAPHDVPVPPTAPAAWWQREDLPQGDPLRKPGPAGAPHPPAAAAPDAPYRRHPHGSGCRRGRRGRGGLGAAALPLSLAAGAAVWALSGRGSGGARLTTVLAAVLLVQGLALLLATVRGRARGLVLPALLTTAALAASGTSAVPLHASAGDRTWAPSGVAQVQRTYSLGAGDAVLDLGRIDPAGGTVATGVRLGAGDLRVTVPSGVRLVVTARSGAGDIRLPDGTRSGGVGNERRADLPPPPGTESKGTVTLDLQVGLGTIRVVRR